MNSCSSCGSPIPDGQGNCCSMCYGDISYGNDGYYQEWAEEQMRKEEEQKQLEQEQLKELEAKKQTTNPTAGSEGVE